jgi:hypothetical protein
MRTKQIDKLKELYLNWYNPDMSDGFVYMFKFIIPQVLFGLALIGAIRFLFT